MTTMIDTLKEWEDEFFDFVTRVEEPIVKFSGEMADSFADYAPERPSWPFLAQVPTVSEIVDFNIGMANRWVDTQATFAKALVKAWQPVLGKLEPKPAPARKPRTGPKAA